VRTISLGTHERRRNLFEAQNLTNYGRSNHSIDTAAAMDEKESALVEARRLRALGNLGQAATLLESVSATWRDPGLLSERAEILMSQGYWTKALGVLEGMKIESDQANSDLLRARIQMQLCFVRPVVEASFGRSVETAKVLHRQHLLGIDWSNADRNSVCLNAKISAILVV
jgi:hypothetical protein